MNNGAKTTNIFMSLKHLTLVAAAIISSQSQTARHFRKVKEVQIISFKSSKNIRVSG